MTWLERLKIICSTFINIVVFSNVDRNDLFLMIKIRFKRYVILMDTEYKSVIAFLLVYVNEVKDEVGLSSDSFSAFSYCERISGEL
ncbi:MAG: hypothetical protein U5K00_08010 [Melioribacteraceae bacterium]|nr:hypothetical protein [Melioribacteraceae bacterium]